MFVEINESIYSDLYRVKGFLEDTIKTIDKVITDQSIIFDIRLILHELLVNGVIHGNCYDKKKKIDVHVKVNTKYIKIEVTDQGMGFKYDRSSYNPFELKCNGRGLVIVDGLSDEFYVNKNKVISVKYL